jgi:hypothetical protein
MSLKEIAFIANWARNNKDVVKLIAANTRWIESGIKEILIDLENKSIESLESEIIVSKHLSEMNKYKVELVNCGNISDKENKTRKNNYRK